MTRLGLALALVGGLTLSFDIPLLRLGDGDAWSVIAFRSTLVAAVGAFAWAIARWLGHAGQLIDGRAGAVIAGLYAVNAITFQLAIHYTTVANVVFILALNPMITALLSWWLVGERPGRATVIAILVTAVGTTVIVFDGLRAGNGFGDAMALATTFLLALAITLTRRDDVDVGFASLVANIFPAALGWVVVAFSGYAIASEEWIVLDGIVVMPLAFFCLAVAPRYVAAPIVAMAFLLETCLAPVWVWLVFGEEPTPIVLLGGSLVLGAVLVHSLWQWRTARLASAGATSFPVREHA